jgi:predicted nucleotide-binding protein (sugar kinase/HSP70/actin superfamily)
MNYDSMTDRELMHYLDLYSDDPLIRRLARMLTNAEHGIIAELEEVGMNPETWKFDDDWGAMHPSEYIEQLRRDVREAEDGLSDLRYRHEDLEEKYNELKTRTIMDFVQEVWQEKRTASFKVQEALKEAQAQKEENDRLREKIDMWARMNQQERKLA